MSVRFSLVYHPPESPLPPSPASKLLASLHLRVAHKFLCTALQGSTGLISARPAPSPRIALPARSDPAQSIHQPFEHSLLLILIAIAHSSAPGVAPDLGLSLIHI